MSKLTVHGEIICSLLYSFHARLQVYKVTKFTLPALWVAWCITNYLRPMRRVRMANIVNTRPPQCPRWLRSPNEQILMSLSHLRSGRLSVMLCFKVSRLDGLWLNLYLLFTIRFICWFYHCIWWDHFLPNDLSWLWWAWKQPESLNAPD